MSTGGAIPEDLFRSISPCSYALSETWGISFFVSLTELSCTYSPEPFQQGLSTQFKHHVFALG